MATRILVTGDYWHSDFKDLIADCPVATTLVTIDKFLHDPSSTLSTLVDDDAGFDLVAIAQSRQGQFDQALIDAVKVFAGATPVVVMLGSWCEGEIRSDRPAEGVKRVFWHQWRGRFSTFVSHLADDGVTLWHGAETETDADRIVHTSARGSGTPSEHLTIGVSAWNVETYDSLSAGIQSFGWKTRWVERSSLSNLAGAINAVCIDANSLDENLERRLTWLKEQVFDVPMVLALNFPRNNEVSELHNMGVSHVVSKPFELNDLRVAIEQAVEVKAKSGSAVPAPKASLKMKKSSV